MKRYVFLLSLIFQTMIMADTKEEILNKIQQEAEVLDSTITKCKQKDAEACKSVGLYWNRADEFELAFFYFKKACDGNNSIGCAMAGIYKTVGKTIPKNKISKNDITVDRLVGLQYLGKGFEINPSDEKLRDFLKSAQNELKNIWLQNIKKEKSKIVCLDSKGGTYTLDKAATLATINSPIMQTYENFLERNCQAIEVSIVP